MNGISCKLIRISGGLGGGVKDKVVVNNKCFITEDFHFISNARISNTICLTLQLPCHFVPFAMSYVFSFQFGQPSAWLPKIGKF